MAHTLRIFSRDPRGGYKNASGVILVATKQQWGPPIERAGI